MPSLAPDWLEESDLETFLGVTLSAPEARFLIDTAQDAIRKYLNQVVTAVDDEIVFIDGSGRDWFRLPERPVTSVTSILDDNLAVTAGTYPTDTWFVRGQVVVRRDRGIWPVGRGNLKVTYSHGWEPEDVPYDIRMVSLNLARRVNDTVGTASGTTVTQEAIGAYSYSTSTDTVIDLASTLTGTEAAILKRYRVTGPKRGSIS